MREGWRTGRRTRVGWWGRGAVAGAALASFALMAQAQLTDAGAFEKSDHVRLVVKRAAPNEVTLYAQLTNCTEVTITLALALTNAVASEPLPVTVDAAGLTFFKLVTVRVANSSREWSYSGSYAWQYGRRGAAAESESVYDLPYSEGVYAVSQAGFGERTHTPGSGSEHAIDWAMPVGTVVCAARAGTVVALRSDSTVGAKSPNFVASSNFVVIRHEDGTFAEYGHLRRNGVLVWLGQAVKSGGVVGFSGSSGYSSGPHLHFCVFQTIDGSRRRSISVRFRTRSGRVETLVEGMVY